MHISRGVRWDSDHVTVLNDELLGIGQELVAYDYIDKIHIGLDYFDATINRTAAWIIGARNMRKSLLIGLLYPKKKAIDSELKGDFTMRLAEQEAAKSLPWNIIWQYYCESHSMPTDLEIMTDIRIYETKVLSNRV